MSWAASAMRGKMGAEHIGFGSIRISYIFLFLGGHHALSMGSF